MGGASGGAASTSSTEGGARPNSAALGLAAPCAWFFAATAAYWRSVVPCAAACSRAAYAKSLTTSSVKALSGWQPQQVEKWRGERETGRG